MITLSQIADKLFAEPQIMDAFVQQTESLDEYRSTKVAGGGWNHAHRRRRAFRVGITTDKKYVEACGETVAQALETAFARMPRTMPAWVTEAADFERGATKWGGTDLMPGELIPPANYKSQEKHAQ